MRAIRSSSTIKHGFVPRVHCRRGLSAAEHRAQAAPRPPVELPTGALRVPKQRVALVRVRVMVRGRVGVRGRGRVGVRVRVRVGVGGRVGGRVRVS